MALFHELMPLRDFRGKLVGKFSGKSFIAGYRDGLRSAIVRWDSPESDPKLITPIDGAVTALDVSIDGRRVAMAVVHNADARFLSSRDPAVLLELGLDPLSGRMLVSPRAGACFGADVGGPRVCWSRDGLWLAMGAVEIPGRQHVCTYVGHLAAADSVDVSIVEGRPIQWRGQHLLLSRGDHAFSSWSASDNEQSWNGTTEWISPDEQYCIRIPAKGAGSVVSRAGEVSLSSCGLAEHDSFDWAGPHHIVVAGSATRQGFDLSRMTACDILPEHAPPSVLEALSPDATHAIFRDGDARFWARARSDD